MNAIFTIIILISAVIILIKNPETLLSAMLEGSESAIKLLITLTAVYSVWLGIFSIMEKSGLNKTISKILSKPISFIFGQTSNESKKYITLNVSANILGLGGIATPMGIEAMKCLEQEKNTFASTMLFVVAATSLQLLPTTVISLRASHLSVNPSDIIIPSFLATMVSTITGILLVKIFKRK